LSEDARLVLPVCIKYIGVLEPRWETLQHVLDPLAAATIISVFRGSTNSRSRGLNFFLCACASTYFILRPDRSRIEWKTGTN